MDLQTELRERLAVCERATAGPWGLGADPNDHEVVSHKLKLMLASCSNTWLDQCKGNPAFIAASCNQRPGELRALAEAWDALAEATTNYDCPPHLAARLDEALARIAALLEGKP